MSENPKITHQAQSMRIPKGANLEEMITNAQDLVEHYVVALAAEGKVFGSGTLVTFNGIHGILTAEHVAAYPRKKEGEYFAICYRTDHIHTLHVDSSQFQKFDFGSAERNASEDAGPDLCFLLITDDKLLSQLSSKKSFYPLGDTFRVIDQNERFALMSWWISGCPSEFSESGELHRGKILTRCSYIQAGAKFIALETQGEFDYLTLEVHKGIHGYPNDCGGMSGGGIWMLAAQQFQDTIKNVPILQGVLFFQTRTAGSATQRFLKGHGPDSVHRQLVELVKPI